jgi:hypothetical protein
MKLRERENILIKNISGDVNLSFRNIETLEPFIQCAITNEHTLFGSKLEFPGIERTKIWPTSTPNSVKGRIIRSL